LQEQRFPFKKTVDERDVEIRMQQATVQRIKRALFLAILVNTALHGCECWAMTDKLCSQLSVFHHKTLPRVLGTNMFAVEQDRIKNEHLRNKLSVCNIADMVQYQQSSCIGELACMLLN